MNIEFAFVLISCSRFARVVTKRWRASCSSWSRDRRWANVIWRFLTSWTSLKKYFMKGFKLFKKDEIKRPLRKPRLFLKTLYHVTSYICRFVITYCNCAGSRQSSKLGLRVLSSNRVSATFVGLSFSSTARWRRVMVDSTSWISWSVLIQKLYTTCTRKIDRSKR